MLLGLTGKRHVGKSTIANVLVEKFGFIKIHAFGPGKAMCVAYAMHLGIDPETAFRMVYGDLRETPHPFMPGDGTMRSFMEKLGYHMGVDMGPEYTLGAEKGRAQRLNPNKNFVVESVVYEAPFFKQLGGVIIKVLRPQVEGTIAGLHTDAAVDNIDKYVDMLFVNDEDDKDDPQGLELSLHSMLHDPVIYDKDWANGTA